MDFFRFTLSPNFWISDEHEWPKGHSSSVLQQCMPFLMWFLVLLRNSWQDFKRQRVARSLRDRGVSCLIFIDNGKWKNGLWASIFSIFHQQRKKHKSLSYRRGTAWRAMLVNSCYVSRGLMVRKVSNSKSDLQGHSRALAMVPYDRPHMISYQCSIATMPLSCIVNQISLISLNFKEVSWL